MAQGISFLYEEYKKNPEKVEKLLDGQIEISEKLDGSRFFVQNDGAGKISFYKRKDVPITKIDRTLSKYYEKAITHFTNFPEEKLESIPEGWRFGLEYFPNLQPVTIAYDRLPLNNLVLTDIQVRDPRDKILEVISDKETLNEWASILEVEAPPVYFEGKLSETQQRRILDFLNSPQDALLRRFKTENFTRFILELLNPELSQSLLHSDTTKEIDGLIFKFDGKEAYRFSNPEIALKKNLKREESPSDVYNLTLVILQEFIASLDFKKIYLKEKSFEERYIEFISKIFNLFLKSPQYKTNFEKGVDFELPKFLTREESGVNFGFVKDPETMDNLKKSGTNRELFKILLASMRTHKRKPSKFFTKELIFHHNKLVDDIADYINSNLKESAFFSFEEFRNVFLGESASWQEEFGKESMEESEDFSRVPVFSEVVKFEKELNPMDVFRKMFPAEDDQLKKTTQVCMMRGKFFPFHNGHEVSVKDAVSASGMKVFLVINRKKTAKFPENLHQQMMDEIVKSNKQIAGYIFTDGMSLAEISRDMPNNYSVGAFAGSETQCDDFINQGGNAPIVILDKQLSSRNLLKKIKEEDIENYRKLVPKTLHNYFHKIKNEVSSE